MAAMADVPNVIRVDLGFTINGIPAATRLFFRFGTTGGAFGTPSCVQLNSAIRASIVANLKPLWPQTTICTQVKTTDLTSRTSAWAADGTTTAGGNVQTGAPANVAMQFNYLINRRYRGGKPRGFFPGGAANILQDPQHWGPSFTTSYQTAFNSLITAIVGAPVTPAVLTQCCVHWFQGHMPNPNAGTWGPANVPKPLIPPLVDDVTIGVAQTQIGSMRGRLRT